MFKSLHKFLIVTVCLSFFISATELDLGKSRNTFFDDADTYIKTEQVSFNLSAVERTSFEAYLFVHVSDLSPILEQARKTVTSPSTIDFYSDPPDLCIWNSTWRI